MGLGISFKLIPILCVPFLLLSEWWMPNRRKRLAVAMVSAFSAAALPFAIQYAVSGPGRILDFQLPWPARNSNRIATCFADDVGRARGLENRHRACPRRLRVRWKPRTGDEIAFDNRAIWISARRGTLVAVSKITIHTRNQLPPGVFRPGRGGDSGQCAFAAILHLGVAAVDSRGNRTAAGSQLAPLGFRRCPPGNGVADDVDFSVPLFPDAAKSHRPIAIGKRHRGSARRIASAVLCLRNANYLATVIYLGVRLLRSDNHLPA